MFSLYFILKTGKIKQTDPQQQNSRPAKAFFSRFCRTAGCITKFSVAYRVGWMLAIIASRSASSRVTEPLSISSHTLTWNWWSPSSAHRIAIG